MLCGRLTTGIAAGAAALNVAACAALLWTAWRASAGERSSGRVLPSVLGLFVAAYLYRAAGLVASPWNPHALVLPLITLVVSAAAVVAGVRSLLPLAVFSASVAAQNHVGVAPTAFAILAAAAGPVLTAAFTNGDAVQRRSAQRILAVAAGLAALLWALPLVEQIRSPRGNLAELWTFFVVNPPDGQRFRTAFAAWGEMLSGIVRPDFAVAVGREFGRGSDRWPETLALAQLALLTAALVWSAVRGDRFRRALSAMCLLASAIGLWSTTRIAERIDDHAVFWISGLGALNLAVIADAAVAALLERRRAWHVPAWAAAVPVAGVVLAAAIAIAEVRAAVDRSRAPSGDQVAARELASRVIAHGVGKPLVMIDEEPWPVAAGMLLELQRARRPFAVEDDWLPMFTDAAARSGDERVQLRVVGRARQFLLAGEGWQTIAAGGDYFVLTPTQTPPAPLPR